MFLMPSQRSDFESCHDINLNSRGNDGNMVNAYQTHMYTTEYNMLFLKGVMIYSTGNAGSS